AKRRRPPGSASPGPPDLPVNGYGEPFVNQFDLASTARQRSCEWASMVIRHFLKWIGNARVSERAAAAGALARAYLDHGVPFEDRCEAEAALTLLLDDPSPKVRAALAEALSMSRHAPPQVIAALAADQEEVAACVLIRSPLLTDLDLIDRAAASTGPIQALIAS